MADEVTVESADEPQVRDCLMCAREMVVVCERGGLSIAEPCPNKCGPGYMKASAATKECINEYRDKRSGA